jgi:hypothetical protein
MKIVSVAMMAMITGVGAQAGETPHNAERTVTVCVEGVAPQTLLFFAQDIASKIFAGIGVTIDWRRGLRDCPVQGIVVSLTDNTPGALSPGALAYASPYEGTHIRLFCDRITRYHDPLLGPHLLAHVLAHEITHILQGVSRHSDCGIMKAQWGVGDFDRMMFKSLAFTSDDIELIQHGLAGRTSRTASFHLAANPESAAVMAQ